MPGNSKPPGPPLQLVEDSVWLLNIPEGEKAIVMEQRDYTATVYRQLNVPARYCLPREDKPLDPDVGEKLHSTDDDLAVWREIVTKQGLNCGLSLEHGVIEVSFFGPDQNLNECFFAACAKLGISTRFAIGRVSRQTATSILFKLREDESKRLDDEYAGFKPKAFTLQDARRGVILNYAPPAKRGQAHHTLAMLPGSLLWGPDGKTYDLFQWRAESGQGPGKPRETAPPAIDYFQIVRASAFASILNIVPHSTWESHASRRSFCEWLARIVRDGTAINANVVFSKASRAIIAEPAHAESLIELICQQRGGEPAQCLEMFRFARKRLEADPSRVDVTGWSGIARIFGEEAQKALRAVLNVGADSSLLEDYAERYLFHSGHSQFIDRQAFREGQSQFIFAKDSLTLRHAPDLIQTRKKPVEAFPIFVKSKLRQDVTDVEIHPDHAPGSIIRVTREGSIVPDDDYAPEHSRLIFNEWAGLYVKPPLTINAALQIECAEKLDHMLSLVTNRHKERADWIKAHMGWTLKHPGQKQQVALVCTGDMGTGKTFLCQDFAEAVFGRYAGKASIQAFDNQFYIPAYVRKLWVSHEEVVSRDSDVELIKNLIRSTEVSAQRKGQDVETFKTFARLAFTSNEINPGLARGGGDRGLFQVTSITARGEGLLPKQFEDRMNKEAKPFYAAYAEFLKRMDVRQTYVKLLIDCAPERIAQVEDLTHSAMRDAEVASRQLTPEQLVAKIIIENGTIHGGFDIAMPFGYGHLEKRVRRAGEEMGLRQFVSADAVRDQFYQAGILRRPENGKLYMFDWKIGALQRLFGQYLGVPLHSHWKIDSALDDMPNDHYESDEMIPWKGKDK